MISSCFHFTVTTALIRHWSKRCRIAAASALPGGPEADQLRALYIRARYHDRQQLSDEEVRLAEALLQKIKTEVEDENRRKREAQYHA